MLPKFGGQSSKTLIHFFLFSQGTRKMIKWCSIGYQVTNHSNINLSKYKGHQRLMMPDQASLLYCLCHWQNLYNLHSTSWYQNQFWCWTNTGVVLELSNREKFCDNFRISGGSFGPNFGFPYTCTFYTFWLLPQLKIGRSASFRPLGWPLLLAIMS